MYRKVSEFPKVLLLAVHLYLRSLLLRRVTGAAALGGP